jgi:hypothetical protein
MGSASKSSSSSSSTQTTDSNNTTLSSSLTGNGGLSINSTGAVTSGAGSNSNLDYAYDSNNPVTTNNLSYALGAGSSASPNVSTDGSPAPASSGGIDWSEIVVYVIAGIILVYVLRLLGDKNS